MHTDEHAAIDLVVPDRQVGVVGIDFNFGIDFGIFRSVVRHGDEHRLLARLDALFQSIEKVSNRCRLLGRFFIPGPEDERTGKNRGNFRHQELFGRFFKGFLFGDDHAVDVGFARIGQVNTHRGRCGRKKMLGSWQHTILTHYDLHSA
jgi:hypothetical protein